MVSEGREQRRSDCVKEHISLCKFLECWHNDLGSVVGSVYTYVHKSIFAHMGSTVGVCVCVCVDE